MASRKTTDVDGIAGGLFVLVGLFVLASGIFYVTGGGGFLGPKYRIKTYLPEAALLSSGAPVRVDGVEVGNVESIGSPRTAGKALDKNKNIEVVMRVDKRYQSDILTDSTASLVTEGFWATAM